MPDDTESMGSQEKQDYQMAKWSADLYSNDNLPFSKEFLPKMKNGRDTNQEEKKTKHSFSKKLSI